MYERFFGFAERPFDLTPNPRYLVLTSSHREVLSNLEYGIASRKGITLLLGEAGSGKTTLIKAAIQRQPALVHCVHLHNPTLTKAEFVEMLAARFELSEHASASKAAMLIELERLLRERRDRGETSVLIVDEAQSLPIELLEEIRLLANIETDDQKLLSVIIAGQPELAGRLNDPSIRQFKQRIALRCELHPLSPAETAGYIAGRIAAAGGVGARVFTREAVAMIHERAAGIPRLVSVIADNALLGGFAAGQRPVGTQVVREVCRDFDVPEGREPVIPANLSLADLPQRTGRTPLVPEAGSHRRLLPLETSAGGVRIDATSAAVSAPVADAPVPAQDTAAPRKRFSLFSWK